MSKIKADIIEPLGTAITISGAAHFTSGNAVLGGLTATNNIVVQGNARVQNGITVSTNGINVSAGGVNVSAGGMSVTGGIAGTLTTAAQPNITSLGTLTSLDVTNFSGNVAPKPISSAGVGQFIIIDQNTAVTLPAGGTWAWFAFLLLATGSTSNGSKFEV